jgi:hypothetical protein
MNAEWMNIMGLCKHRRDQSAIRDAHLNVQQNLFGHENVYCMRKTYALYILFIKSFGAFLPIVNCTNTDYMRG